MSSGNGGNGHGGDGRIDVLEERVRNLIETILAQQVTLTAFRVQMGLLQADLENQRERIERLETGE